MHVKKIFSKGPWTVHSSLLVLQSYSHSFSVKHSSSLEVLVWIEFLNLPYPLLSILQIYVEQVGHLSIFNPKDFLCLDLPSGSMLNSTSPRIGQTKLKLSLRMSLFSIMFSMLVSLIPIFDANRITMKFGNVPL